MKKSSGVRVEVMLFTDPYCSWCWASEPMFFALAEKYREQLHFVYVFGGLVKDMDDFSDGDHGITGALDVLPHWKEVSEYSGQPIDESIWVDIAKIRHFSSWPANIACKAAFLQDEKLGEKFLRNMRQKVQTDRKIISLEEVYLEIAQETEGLDIERFKSDLQNGNAQSAFEADLRQGMRWGANVFPTLLFYRSDADPEHLTPENAASIGGHHPTKTYDEIIRRLVPDIKAYEARDEKTLLETYGPLTEREIAEIRGRKTSDQMSILEELEKAGIVRRMPKVRGNLWIASGQKAGQK